MPWAQCTLLLNSDAPRVHWFGTFFLQIDTTRSVLNLYTDASKTTLIRSVNAANLTPFVINADGFAYTFSDKGKPDVAVKSWGYRIVVSPIWRLQVGARSSTFAAATGSTGLC